MSIPIRVLIVEDSPGDAELMLGNLAGHGFAPQAERVETEADYLAGLNAVPDVILADYQLPHFSGPRALELLNARAIDIPFIGVSGTVGDEQVAEIMKQGACDFLLKDRMARLGPAVTQALKLKDARDERRLLEAALAERTAELEAALREAEENAARYRALTETAMDAIITVDEQQNIVLFNTAAERMFGYSGAAVIGQPLDLLLPGSFRTAHREHVRRFHGGASAMARDTAVFGLRADGTQFLIEVSIARVKIAQGTFYTAILRDITERKLQEQKIARLSRIHAVLSGINSLIVRVGDRQELFNEACRIAVEHGGFGIAWIGMLDPDTLDVSPVAWAGIGAESFPHAPSSARGDVPEGQNAVGRAIQGKQPVIVNDLAAESAFEGLGGPRRKEAIRRGYRSLAVFPLLTDDSTVGVLALFVQEANFFTDDELKLLTELAGDISFSLQSIAKQEKLDKLSRIRAVSGEINAAIVRIREREPLLKDVCRIAVEHGKFELVWIGMFEQKMQKVQPLAWAGFSPEIAHAVNWPAIGVAGVTLGEVMQTRKIAVRNDIKGEAPVGILRQEALKKGCHSTVCLPLVVNDAVVAAIILFAAGTRFFDKDELALLNEVAINISFALQSMAQQEKLDYLAYYDALTGLPNRTLFDDRMAQHLRAASHEKNKTALVLIDLDRFRAVNDTLGRNTGDGLLKLVAARLQSVIFDRDTLARVHGDVFAVLFPDIKDEADTARIVEEKIIGCLSQPFALAGQELRVSAKAGVALFPGDATESDELFTCAEAALRQAKGSSDRYLFYARKMNAMVAERLKLENKLQQALEQEQFVLFYQPKVDLRTGGVTGLEALMRWNDPGTGLVPPMLFIPLLEETGMIVEVGAWAMKQAVLQYAAWQAAGLQPPRIAVNVSQAQLKRKDFVTSVQQAIAVAGNPDHGLDLEITESMIMEDIESSIGKLKLVRELGVGIAIDDFGTGHSSLRYLTRLPLTALKVDRAFVQDMTTNPDNMAIVSTIITLARTMNLKVIAEGVETEEQSKFLRLLKCDEMQGYLFSKPVPAEQVPALLARGGEKR